MGKSIFIRTLFYINGNFLGAPFTPKYPNQNGSRSAVFRINVGKHCSAVRWRSNLRTELRTRSAVKLNRFYGSGACPGDRGLSARPRRPLWRSPPGYALPADSLIGFLFFVFLRGRRHLRSIQKGPYAGQLRAIFKRRRDTLHH